MVHFVEQIGKTLKKKNFLLSEVIQENDLTFTVLVKKYQ
jgi:hypothetical protein